MKPFVKRVTVSSGAASAIPMHDSSGIVFPVNYIEVRGDGETGGGTGFYVTLSSLQEAPYVPVGANTASGTVGFGGVHNGSNAKQVPPPVIIELEEDLVTEIQIRNQDTAAHKYIVNYGRKPSRSTAFSKLLDQGR